MSNQLTINTITLDKSKLIDLINNKKQLEAIKYIKEETGLGLKDCKDIVDNLYENPDYYGGAENTIIEPTIKKRNTIVKNNDRDYKGGHIIQDKPNDIKKTMLFIGVLIISIVVYFLFKS
ncbi:ribosomal L7/L12-like protein [Lacinutrix venerupis]|uniref:hypothetical protein n=1 Tax=Lacinutrix venerupis TaxID=1486034 RepID=UPI000EB23624|nr:hypothetical protein [Lacinutrix venerupis]RLJ64526.1 ribosomal L7/L12-like protein [Lacinutrix venerupis]